MNKQKLFVLVLTLALIGGTGAWLAHFHQNQKLGRPGVKTSTAPDSHRLRVELPERVLDYKSEWIDPDELTLATLPKDTSFGQRRCTAPDGFSATINVVLMGGDRTSLHKPQFCLEGQGWHIDQAASLETTLPIVRPRAYSLPIVRLIADKEITVEGRTGRARGVYVYWYAADGVVSASTLGLQRMWWMARDLFRTGTLQRWAYISCFVPCAAGQEEATFERIKKLLIAAVPEFQFPPRTEGTTGPAAR